MTLFAYQIFHAVAQQGSFARAAELLHVTPSAISHAVAGMEEEFGFSLFARTKSGVKLTGSGASLLPAVEMVLNSHENTMQQVAEINGMQKGSVRIGAFNSVCVSWLPRIITGFKEKFPAIDVEIWQGDYNDVAAWLRDGVVDLGFLSADASRETCFFPLYEDPLVCIAPFSFGTREPGRVSIEEMRGQPFVIQSSGCDADVQNYLKKYRLEVRSSCHVADDQSTVAMVQSGLGISIMPRMLMESGSASVQVLPIEPGASRTIGMACLSEAGMSPAAKQMLRFVQEMMRGKK